MKKTSSFPLKTIFLFLLSLIGITSIQAQTIKEKKEGLIHGVADLDPQSQELLRKTNIELVQKQEELTQLYSKVKELFDKNAQQEAYHDLLKQINKIKASMDALDNTWREGIIKGNQEEGYGLWYQPDTTIEELVIDYGTQDYVYLIPQEIATMKLSVASNLPVPRSSWNEMLELILTQNGVGIQQINPFLRKLYLLAINHSAVKLVTDRLQDLEIFPSNTQICFVLSPEPSEVKRIWFFLDKFVNHQSTVLQLIGREILIIGSIAEIQDLLKLYDFAASNRGDKEYKLVSLSRISAEEMTKILEAIFDQIVDRNHNSSPESIPTEIQQVEGSGLKVILLSNMAQALFLVGTKEEICKAEEIIREVDCQLGDVREKVIYRYAVKNSDAEEIAEVISKIYNLMVREDVGYEKREVERGMPPPQVQAENSPAPGAPMADAQLLRPQNRLYAEGFFQEGSVAVNPAPVNLVSPPVEFTTDNRLNFIVDVKTNSIVMVVEADILPKIKELLKKLDVPKKMVQIEVLLLEKRISNSTQFGLNLLRLGSAASQTHKTAMTFNDIFPIGGLPNPFNRGLTSFILSRPKEHGPAFDIIYNFLMSQQDVQINASPSVITMNQTPAKLAIVEELSINTGIFEVETAKGTTLKDAFTRAQYGITLEITPTIHMPEEGSEYDDDDMPYIGLETTVNFDTVQPSIIEPNRPLVTRRNIENEVIIPDGQTVILGGLRRKNIRDSKEAIPFIGEIPGIGKLFSNTNLEDSSTEMIIFITPRIISDLCDDLDRLRWVELTRRPGDIPEFICCLEAAKLWEREFTMEGTMKMLFGRQPERCFDSEGEYDGR